MRDSNKHVREYLEYYFSFPHPPRFAVLIGGPWGIGKTFIVKRLLRELLGDERKYAYVSLYGAASIGEIEDRLLQAMYPVLGWKSTKVAGRLVKSAAKYFGVDADISVKDMLSRLNAEVCVFDDLERCAMPTNEVLGYINEFVEHDDCKVIIIANESEISGGDQYRRRREKLIGKTLEVQSAFDEALSFFTSQIDYERAKSVLQRRSAEIEGVYRDSGLNNLRILQQTMWDFERVARVLKEKHWHNDAAILALLRLFFAISFEMKAGRIGPDDLKRRFERAAARMLAEREETEGSPMMKAQERYPDIDLNDQILSDAVLIDVLVKGLVDREQICSSLDRSPYFVEPGEEPAWRTVWYSYERPENEVVRAIDVMDKEFSERKFTAPGEMMHVFGLQLWLAEIGHSGKTRAGVISDAKKYIDDLYDQRRLALLTDDEDDEVRFGYGGLMMYEREATDFQELWAYLQEKRRKATEDTFPARAAQLLEEVKADPELFARRLGFHQSDDLTYYRIPILAWIDPNEFVSTVLGMSPEHQRTIMRVFKDRYGGGLLLNELNKERPWLQAVSDKMTKAADSLSPIARHIVTRNLKQYVTPFIRN